MIVVKMELWPGGDRKGKRMLGVITIANDGKGTVKVGNYTYALSHAGKYFASPKKKEPYKSGKVVKFPRAYSPYRLLCRVLKDAGEE